MVMQDGEVNSNVLNKEIVDNIIFKKSYSNINTNLTGVPLLRVLIHKFWAAGDRCFMSFPNLLPIQTCRIARCQHSALSVHYTVGMKHCF